MQTATDKALVSYRGLVESLAAELARSPRARQVGAEYDDLVQEGLIAVWQTIERGHRVGKVVVEGRMKDWIKYLGKRNGEPYEANMPLDDFRDLARSD